jgi:hypothetical protein
MAAILYERVVSINAEFERWYSQSGFVTEEEPVFPNQFQQRFAEKELGGEAEETENDDKQKQKKDYCTYFL